MAKKKKPAPSNPARGFATTSMPSKPKQTIPVVPPKPPTPPPAAPEAEWQPPTAEEEAEREFRTIIEKNGPRVRREAQRIVVKAETEKRTLRTSAMYYPLKLDKVFGIESERASGNVEGAEETLGEKVLRMARKEYQAVAERFPVVREPGEALMTAAWTLHRVMIGLGLRSKVVEDAIKAVVGRQRKGTLETENLLEEVLEWIMLFAESEDLPRFLDMSAGTQKKGTPSASGTSTPAMIPEPTVADTRHHTLPSRETSKPLPPPLEKPPLNVDSNIPNIALETKDISDQGEDLCPSDTSESEFEDEELTPENMIPKYLEIQTKLYKIHPTVSSTVTGGKKAKGGGRKPTKVQPGPPPAHLPEAEKKKVKLFHQKLAEIERDPLFDAYEADTAWRDQRSTLEEDGWAKKQPRKRGKKPNPSQGAQPASASSANPTPAGDDDDDGLMGGLFDGPPTEESSSAGENITIRDFEDAPTSIMASKLAKKSGQGKSGVAAHALRKLVQEICKSRHVTHFRPLHEETC
ncbi:hypothetical protein EX30DRAFT_374736 [Ascodesmis nigricans]|uniref:Uncharacterized protein n=1 Tax=Ascodesmis nigricans TaxID=341454 RepID=A0A4S2MKD3_9PEZI|nr:hypothetical protein EX30DRAFT_374736 [Ascodesmis nigricans]